MAISTPRWTRDAGLTPTWSVRSRRGPSEATATEREVERLRRENRRRLRDEADRIALLQLSARR